MIHVFGPKDRGRVAHVRAQGIEIIDTTSHARGKWSHGLSPFFLGPVNLYGSYEAKNMENAWQYSKVYRIHLDDKGNPSDDYFRWAVHGWSLTRAMRYPMGKGVVPEYSYWDGDKLDYIEARKRIYIPLYAAAVQKTEAWEELVSRYKSEKDIYLWDFDGYDYITMGRSLKQVVNDPERKMGHAFVLALLLSSTNKGS